MNRDAPCDEPPPSYSDPTIDLGSRRRFLHLDVRVAGTRCDYRIPAAGNPEGTLVLAPRRGSTYTEASSSESRRW